MAENSQDAELRIKADPTQAKDGVRQIKTEVQSLGPTAQKAGEQASKGLDGIGQAGEKSAQQVERSTKNLIGQIRRVTAEMQAGGRASAQYFEAVASQRGVPVDALKPYLVQLEEATKSQQRVGLTAKEMSFALRGVPTQFTDIATSIASGQRPLQVLLQQGGQLKDMFGGIGPAARALGGYIVGLINPLTIAAAAGAALFVAWKQGAAEAEAYNRALILTGNAAGTTADKLGEMARRISAAGGTQSEAAAALAEMAGSTRIGAQNLERFAQVAASIERTIGTPVSKTREMFEDLAKSPAEAILKLNDQYNFLNAAIYRQIRALEDQGKATEAADLAQRTFADAMADRTSKLEQNLGTIERAWRGIIGAAKSAWDAMLNVGRPDSLRDQIKSIDEKIATAQAAKDRSADSGLFGIAVGGIADARLATLKAQRDILLENIRLEERASLAAGERSQIERARIEWMKDGEKFLTKEQKLAIEINKIRADGLRARMSEAEIEQRIAAARAAAAGGSKGDGAAAKEARELAAAQAEAFGLQREFMPTLERYQKLRAAGVLSEEEYVKAVESLIQKQPFARDLTRDQAEETKKLSQAQKESLAASMAAIEARQKDASASRDIAAKLEDEASRYGLTADQIANLALTRELNAGAAKRERLEVELATTTSQAEVIAIQKQIEALDEETAARIRNAQAAANSRSDQANKQAAQTFAREWDRTSQQVEQALANALMDGGRNALDYIKGIFRTAVLQPLMRPIANTVTGVVNGLIGGPTPGGALGGVGQIGSTISSANSLISGASTAGAWLSTVFSPVATDIGVNAAIAGGMDAAIAAGAAEGVAAGSAAAASAGSALSTLAAAAPYVAVAAVAIMALMKEGGGPKSGGSAVATIGGSVMTQAERDARLFTPSGSDAQLLTTTMQLAGSVQTLAQRFGGDASAVRFGLGFDTDPQGTASNRISAFAGNFSVQNRDLGRDAEALQKGLADEVVRLTLAGLQASNLTGGFAEIFARLDPATAAPEAISNLIALAEGIRNLGDSMKSLPGSLGRVTDLSATLREQMVTVSGGFDALSSNLGAYYQNFFSDEERATAQRARLQSAFDGVSGVMFDVAGSADDVRARFRSLVEGISVVDTATASQYAALVALAGPLNDFLTTTQSLGTAATQAAIALGGMTQAAADAVKVAEGWPTADDWIRMARAIGDSDVLIRSLRISFEQAWARLDLGDAFPAPKSIDEFKAAITGIDISAQASLEWAGKLRGALNLGDEFAQLMQAVNGTGTGIVSTVNALQKSIGELGSIRSLMSSGEFASRLQPLLQAQWSDLIAGATIAIPATVPTSAAALLSVYDELAATQPELAAAIVRDFLPAWNDLQQALTAGGAVVSDTLSGIAASISSLGGIRSLMTDDQFAQRLAPLLQAQWTGILTSLGEQASLFDIPVTVPMTKEGMLAVYDELAAIVPSVAESLARDFLPSWNQLFDSLNGNPAAQAANDFERMAERMRDALGNLGDYARSLFASQLSPLPPAEQFAAAQQIFRDTLTAARGGDINAVQSLQGASNTYLQESRDFFGSNEQAANVFREVTQALLALTGAMAPTETFTPAEQTAYTQRGSMIEILQDLQRRVATIEGRTPMAAGV